MKLFIFAGELSGDMHGGLLLEAIKRYTKPSVSGVPGPALRKHEIESVLPMEAFSVMGLSDVLLSLPRLWKQFNCIRDYILDVKPDIVIFIDSPSFSLRMAKVLRKQGFKGKIIQYICPTVWAWGKERIQQLVDNFDLLLTIYPFELEYFAHTSLQVKYVGNPLQEIVSNYQYHPNWRKIFGLPQDDPVLALFPGSRLGEIQRNLSLQLEAAKLLQEQDPKLSIAISCAQESNLPAIQKILKNDHLQVKKLHLIPKDYSYDLMRSCRAAIAKSGTVTLELALHQCPSLVMYQLSTLNKLYAKYLLKLKLPHYCIVNILKQKTVFPELIDASYTAEDLYNHLRVLYEEGVERHRCLIECQEIQAMFKEKNASLCAAQAILGMQS